mmetsp:Transcript_1312/g.2884  ORF Transcript_1312/g.2884 Transcript_1312/m.2884 type:complete len:263 (-) Transcript_1312:1230-2018(-)
MKIVGHKIKLRKNGSNLPHLDIRNVVRIARKGGGQTVVLAGRPRVHIQCGLDGGEHFGEVLLVGGRAAVVGVARILPIDIDPIEIVILENVDAIPRKCIPRLWIGAQRWKIVAQCPSSYRRIHRSPRPMRPYNQPGIMLVIRAIHLVRPVVRTPLHPSPHLARIRPEQQLRIAPSIRAVNVPPLVRLEEGVVDALDLGEVHVGGFGEFVAIVPLPAGVVSDDFFGGAVGRYGTAGVGGVGDVIVVTVVVAGCGRVLLPAHGR